MSRSYKSRPYIAITGCRSAKQDKILAHRGERRKQNFAIKKHGVDENFLLPHRYECRHNDVCDWDRDGRQHYCSPAKHGHKDWFVRMMRK